MEVFETIRKRQSVRCFTDKEISYDDIKKIVEAGVLAPTGRNSQNLLIVGVKDKKTVKKLMNYISGGKEYYGAPAVIFVFEKFPDNLSELNAGAAMENMLLAATGLNIASCWIHRGRNLFASEDAKLFLKETLNLDKTYVLLESIALGIQKDVVPVKEKNPDNGKVI